MHWILALYALTNVSMATWSDDPLDDNNFFAISSQTNIEQSLAIEYPKLAWPGFAEPRNESKLISENGLLLERTERFGF